MTLKKLIKSKGFQFSLGTFKDLFLFRTNINNKIAAGIPVKTLKLKGGISSSAILNKDQTELQTITKKISKIIVKKL